MDSQRSRVNTGTERCRRAVMARHPNQGGFELLNAQDVQCGLIHPSSREQDGQMHSAVPKGYNGCGHLVLWLRGAPAHGGTAVDHISGTL